MTDVRKRYGEITKEAKRRIRANPPKTAEEKRIFDVFRRRAREDYRTLRNPKKESKNATKNSPE